MYNNDDFNTDATDYYGKQNNSSSSYDKVFKSYNSNGNKDKKTTDTSKLKILIIIFITLLVGVIGIILYTSKDKIKNEINDIIDNQKKPIIEVELLDESLSLITGETKKLNYKMANSNNVSLLTFSSSNTTVAKVDKEGNVKAIGAGEAIITLTYTGENGQVSKTCPVDVKNQASNIEDDSEQQKINESIQKDAEEMAKKKKALEEAARKAAEEAAKQRAYAQGQKKYEESQKK